MRATLPALFSETFLNFAATFSKTFQLVDIEEDEQQEDEEAAADVVSEESKEEEEAELEKKETKSVPTSPKTPSSPSFDSPAKSHHHGFHHFRTTLSQKSPKFASALHLDPAQSHKSLAEKHPLLRHPKQILQRSVKKSVVEKIDGAWCAKWSNKVLRKLESAEGDLGYSGQVEVGVVR